MQVLEEMIFSVLRLWSRVSRSGYPTRQQKLLSAPLRIFNLYGKGCILSPPDSGGCDLWVVGYVVLAGLVSGSGLRCLTYKRIMTMIVVCVPLA